MRCFTDFIKSVIKNLIKNLILFKNFYFCSENNRFCSHFNMFKKMTYVFNLKIKICLVKYLTRKNCYDLLVK
jgi:hypothetical protein